MSFINTFEDKDLPDKIFEQVFPGFHGGGKGMRIIIDAFGGDNAPGAVLEGCSLASTVLMQYNASLVLTGDEEKIRAAAKEKGVSLDKIEVVHAPTVIPVCEEPTQIRRKYKDCSMAVGLRMLAEGKGDAFITAGSTGAMVVGATLIAKRIKGVKRAAIATPVPNAKGRYLLLDSGANDECRPEMLRQFGVMGAVYAEKVMGIPAPRVGLVNIGTEDSKGTSLQVETNKLLRETGVNYVGNVEARELPLGGCDVAVADGFTGNVVLKLTEGMGKFFSAELKGMLFSSLATKLGAVLLSKQIKGFKKRMDASEVGGALLLGIRHPVIKAHGNSDGRAFLNAIRQAAICCSNDVVGQITASLLELSAGDSEEDGEVLP